jgi:hypothetical protein
MATTKAEESWEIGKKHLQINPNPQKEFGTICKGEDLKM